VHKRGDVAEADVAERHDGVDMEVDANDLRGRRTDDGLH